MHAKHAVEAVVLDRRAEIEFVAAWVERSIQENLSLFVARFVVEACFGKQPSSPRVEIRQYGAGCFVNASPLLADALRAQQGLEEAEAAIRDGNFSTVILSRILDAVQDGVLCHDDLMASLNARREPTRLILTGCDSETAVALLPEMSAAGWGTLPERWTSAKRNPGHHYP